MSGACQTRVHTPQWRRQISAREHSLKAVYLSTSLTLVPSTNELTGGACGVLPGMKPPGNLTPAPPAIGPLISDITDEVQPTLPVPMYRSPWNIDIDHG